MKMIFIPGLKKWKKLSHEKNIGLKKFILRPISILKTILNDTNLALNIYQIWTYFKRFERSAFTAPSVLFEIWVFFYFSFKSQFVTRSYKYICKHFRICLLEGNLKIILDSTIWNGIIIMSIILLSAPTSL